MSPSPYCRTTGFRHTSPGDRRRQPDGPGRIAVLTCAIAAAQGDAPCGPGSGAAATTGRTVRSGATPAHQADACSPSARAAPTAVAGAVAGAHANAPTSAVALQNNSAINASTPPASAAPTSQHRRRAAGERRPFAHIHAQRRQALVTADARHIQFGHPGTDGAGDQPRPCRVTLVGGGVEPGPGHHTLDDLSDPRPDSRASTSRSWRVTGTNSGPSGGPATARKLARFHALGARHRARPGVVHRSSPWAAGGPAGLEIVSGHRTADYQAQLCQRVVGPCTRRIDPCTNAASRSTSPTGQPLSPTLGTSDSSNPASQRRRSPPAQARREC